MRFINAVEAANYHIRSLWIVIGCAFVLNILVIAGWVHSQSKIKIELPPQIPQSGLIVTQGEVPASTVYSFAFYVWQSVNHWSENGLLDYKQQITKFSPFLTPDFKLKLIQNYNNLLNQGELQDRIRLMQGTGEFVPMGVKYLGHNTWLVELTMQLTEMINLNAKVVKDVQMHYTLKIVRYDVDPQHNPWGLALAGFAESPERIKTTI